jgi:hypothetical protein
MRIGPSDSRNRRLQKSERRESGVSTRNEARKLLLSVANASRLETRTRTVASGVRQGVRDEGREEEPEVRSQRRIHPKPAFRLERLPLGGTGLASQANNRRALGSRFERLPLGGTGLARQANSRRALGRAKRGLRPVPQAAGQRLVGGSSDSPNPLSEPYFILGRRVSACDRPPAALRRAFTDRSEGSLPSYRWRCSTPFPAKRAITECQDLGVRKSGVRIPSLRDGHLRFSTPNSGSATAAGDRGIEDSAFRIPYRQPTLQNWDISSKQGPPLWPDVS